MSDCHSLRTIPKSFGLLQCLEQLNLKGCHSLQTLLESSGSLSSLRKLLLEGFHSLQELPETLGRLPKLWYISLVSCKTLKSLPKSFGWLKRLEILHLRGCSSLEDIPKTFGQLEKLRHLYLSDCDHLRSLPDSFGHLQSLDLLYLVGCNSLERLPPSFFMLLALEILLIRGCGLLEPIGEQIASLTIRPGITEQQLSMIKAKNDNSLASVRNYLVRNSSVSATVEDLPDNVGDFCNLETLVFNGSSQLELPQSFRKLSNLTCLTVESCFNLQQFPNSFSKLHGLKYLRIVNCPNLQRVSNLPTRLHPFSMDYCESIEVLDVSELHSLQDLEVRACSSLKNIMGLIRLDGINSLTVQDCMNLTDIGGSHITDNNESCCWDLLLMPGLDPFKNLHRLMSITVSGQVFSRNSATIETNIIAPYNSSLLCDAIDQSSDLIGISSPKCSFFPLKLDDNSWVIGGDRKEEFSCVTGAIFLIVGDGPSDSPFEVCVDFLARKYTYEFWNEGEAALLQMEFFNTNFPEKASVGYPVVVDRKNVVKGGWICYLEIEGEICDDNEKFWGYFVKECKKHLRHSLSTVSSDLPTTVVVWNPYFLFLKESLVALMKRMLNPY